MGTSTKVPIADWTQSHKVQQQGHKLNSDIITKKALPNYIRDELYSRPLPQRSQLNIKKASETYHKEAN